MFLHHLLSVCMTCLLCDVLQVATAIRGAIILAKMSVIPVRRGYWGNKIGKVSHVWIGFE